MKKGNSRCRLCSKPCFSAQDRLCCKCRSKGKHFLKCHICRRVKYRSKCLEWIITVRGPLYTKCQRQKQEDCAA